MAAGSNPVEDVDFPRTSCSLPNPVFRKVWRTLKILVRFADVRKIRNELAHSNKSGLDVTETDANIYPRLLLLETGKLNLAGADVNSRRHRPITAPHHRSTMSPTDTATSSPNTGQHRPHSRCIRNDNQAVQHLVELAARSAALSWNPVIF